MNFWDNIEKFFSFKKDSEENNEQRPPENFRIPMGTIAPGGSMGRSLQPAGRTPNAFAQPPIQGAESHYDTGFPTDMDAEWSPQLNVFKPGIQIPFGGTEDQYNQLHSWKQAPDTPLSVPQGQGNAFLIPNGTSTPSSHIPYDSNFFKSHKEGSKSRFSI